MKKNVEARILKTVVKALTMEKKMIKESTSICPAIFHQPKRPQKRK